MNNENMSDYSSTTHFGKFHPIAAWGRYDLFFALHSISGGKLNICGRDDLSLFWGGKLDIHGRDDLFLLFTRFLGGKLDIYGRDAKSSSSHGLDLSLRNPIHTAGHVFKSQSFSVMSSDARPPAPFGWR